MGIQEDRANCADSPHLAATTTSSTKDELETVRELSKVLRGHIVLKYLHPAGIGRRHILWSVIKLACAVSKWNTV